VNVVDWAVSTMEQLGGPGLALLIFLENVFPPIPSEVVLPLAGVAAAGPGHSYPTMLAWSLVGSISGAWLLYGLGRALGPVRLRRVFDRLPLVHVEDFDRTVSWMDRFGGRGVLLGRMVPGIRSLISVPAGLYAMRPARFTMLTLVGSAIWNALFIGAGYLLGENWHLIEPYTDVFSHAVYLVIALVVVWTVLRLVLRERGRRAAAPVPESPRTPEPEA
jgi:membrane protein DedA with SNARE-associated domain